MAKPKRKRGRKQGPFFKDKTQRRSSKYKVLSQKTGIAHEFGNVQGWEDVIARLEDRSRAEQAQVLSSLPFYNWLAEQEINKSHLNLKLADKGFRYANPKFGPLTLLGNVGDGGRFNVGSAQMHPNFPSLDKFGCVYFSSSSECASIEAARPIGCHKMYEITVMKEIVLWDMKAVIENLRYDSLMDAVRESYGDRMWCLQKVPLISQILGHRLKGEGGAGIIFESTKLPGHSNIALFFDTDDEVKQVLSASIIVYP